MSTLADPNKAYVWLDGDGYRAPKGTGVPTSPFVTNPVTGALNWDGFGGIETGFEVTPQRTIKTLPVWNRRSAPYKAIKSPREDRVKLKPVDYSVASVLTALEGGSIVETSPGSGVFKWLNGNDENFACLLVVRDQGTSEALYSPNVTLTTPPPSKFGGETLDGFEIELLALEPFIRLTSWNPLSTTKTVTLTGGTFTAGTFTLTVATQSATATTATIAYNAANTAVDSALEALANVGVGNATVTGSAGGPYTVTLPFPATITGSGTGLTPAGTIVVS